MSPNLFKWSIDMFNLKKIFGCFAVLAVISVPAQASLAVLDSFNYDPSLSMEVNPNVNVSSATVQSAESGATASYELTWLGGKASDTVKGNAFTSGSLSYAEEPLADGSLELAYSLAGVNNTFDFTNYSDIYFDVVAIDGSGGFDVKYTLEDFDGTSISASYNVNAAGMFFANIANMMPGVDFDLSRVSKITAFFESAGNGDDFTIDEIGFVQVSEPSALAILGLALVGLGLRRRKSVK